ncbi:MAG: tRNA (adenine-N1)-methyltransferase [Armatimonadota bacterium]|nr:tRNA (adenine-N1)-methyltransferase [Armatimonadota bacterium]MCX7778463.1 tRNA (adenine-N1)-methyltransferase [Armatimonadota bacterium]MDW8026042.1 tRNA (adenine-N1)-methyltransferase [Armatimonadota bacterium]
MHSQPFQDGDVVLLVDEVGNKWVTKVSVGKFTISQGTINLSELIGKAPGCAISTHLGYRCYAFRPTPNDLVMHAIKRETQIAYPKEMGYLILRLGIVPGCRVVEAGTGSGASTLLFASAVGDDGKVYSYERRLEFTERARRNLELAGLLHRVEFKVRDIASGFDEKDVDAVFLDVRTPWEYLEQSLEALATGGSIGILVPTTNQICETLRVMQRLPLVDIEVCEILVRHYKPNPERLRPEDRMVAHTAFLIAARKVTLAKGDFLPAV